MAQSEASTITGNLPVAQPSHCQNSESLWSIFLMVASTFYWSM
jgi:hypothetical protein